MKARGVDIQSESGMAIVETLPLLVIFVVLFIYMLGAFGVIHTGILSSIGARTYAFETFRHRANLTYFRGNSDKPPLLEFSAQEVRIHGIQGEQATATSGYGTPVKRSIRIGENDSSQVAAANVHNTIAETVRDGQRNTTVGVNPVWIMVQYGMCLNTSCGGD